MFKRILVPLDGSPRAEQALALAAHIAQANHSSMYLLQSVEIINIYNMRTLGMMERIQELEEQEARKYLDRIKGSTLLARIPTTIQVYVGNASLAILDAIKLHDIDLVVLCSHGYTGIKNWALGSVAQKVARACPVPVLIQRDEHPLLYGDELIGQSVFQVCVALDGSPQAEAVIEPAIAIAAACASPHQADVHLLRIIEPLSSSNEETFREIYHFDLQTMIQQQTQTYLQDVIQRLEQTARLPEGIKLVSNAQNGADAAQEIIRYAEKSHDTRQPSCQLLAMTTHGRDKLERLFFGSIADRILTQTKLPLLIVRPPMQEESAQATPVSPNTSL
ncbi:universal stress protein UspA [Dictyobacter alpinus]|uniref:Universal stress protein UspA n=1 Tax=Dictyobacter alpinus TaxID=2014873 RepID=A0A402BFU5_9CHLR|nr:universal stress protein [Dictyobacter alpinus]GCE30137.1 universal stress protein UspA [Dictyobacter alpinus]